MVLIRSAAPIRAAFVGDPSSYIVIPKRLKNCGTSWRAAQTRGSRRICSVIPASRHACGVGLPPPIDTSIYRSTVTISSAVLPALRHPQVPSVPAFTNSSAGRKFSGIPDSPPLANRYHPLHRLPSASTNVRHPFVLSVSVSASGHTGMNVLETRSRPNESRRFQRRSSPMSNASRLESFPRRFRVRFHSRSHQVRAEPRKSLRTLPSLPP